MEGDAAAGLRAALAARCGEIEQLAAQAAVHQRKFGLAAQQIRRFVSGIEEPGSADGRAALQSAAAIVDEVAQLIGLYQPQCWAQAALDDPCNSVPSQLAAAVRKLRDAADALGGAAAGALDAENSAWLSAHIEDLRAISASFNQYVQSAEESDGEVAHLMKQRLRSLNGFLAQYEADPELIAGQGSRAFSPIPVNYQSWRLRADELEEVREVGSGVSAHVFYGIDTRSGREVAIKRLKFDKLTGVKLQSFQREISILSSVSHPALLGFVGATDEPPYCIVTEWMANGNLYQELHKFKRMNSTMRAIAAFDVARGMQYLHSRHIIHRDLKSLNVLIDSKGHAHICDFGFSKREDEDDFMTGNVGTPHWMAPELLSGSGCYSSKIDVYAYGILLWEIATGLIPYQGIDSNQVLAQVMMNDLRPAMPSYVNKNLRELIQLCWDKDPEKRPSFKEIIRIFRTGKIMFNGADNDSFIKYMNENGDIGINETEELENKPDNDDVIEELIENIEKYGIPDNMQEKYWNIFEKCNNPDLSGRGLIHFLNTPMKLKASSILRGLPPGSIPPKIAVSIAEMIPSDSSEFDDNIVIAACKNGAADTILVLATSPVHIKIALEVVSRQGVDISLKAAVADRCFLFLDSDDESLVCSSIRCLFGICEQKRITIKSIQKFLNTSNVGLRNCIYLSIAYLADSEQEIPSEFVDYFLDRIDEDPIAEVTLLSICSKSPQLSLHLINRFIQEKRKYHEILLKILVISSKSKFLHSAIDDMLKYFDYDDPIFLQTAEKIRNYINAA